MTFFRAKVRMARRVASMVADAALCPSQQRNGSMKTLVPLAALPAVTTRRGRYAAPGMAM